MLPVKQTSTLTQKQLTWAVPSLELFGDKASVISVSGDMRKLNILLKEQKWPQEDVSNVRNKGSNNPLISQRKRNTETDIKQSLSYGTAPGIEC